MARFNRRGFIAALGGVGMSACSHRALGAPAVSVTDFRGKRLALERPARRIVCLIESALSGLCMLGVTARVVGVPANVYSGDVSRKYVHLDPRLAEHQLAAPGNWDFVSLEGVLALRPDLVVIWSHQRESIEALERRGIPVYAVFIASVADLRKEIRDLAVLTESTPRGESLIAQADREIHRVARAVAVPEPEKPSVYFAWGQGLLETAGRGSCVDELIALAGGRNVCTDSVEHATISLEKILTWNPDVIVLWHSTRISAARVLANPQWRHVSAVRTGRVFQLPEVFECDLWTLKFQQALRLMANWFHPGHFSIHGGERDQMMQALYAQSIPR